MGLRFAHRVSEKKSGAVPTPEDIFLAWLLSRRPDEDIRAAADREIRKLRDYEGSHAGPVRLIALFEELCATDPGAYEALQ